MPEWTQAIGGELSWPTTAHVVRVVAAVVIGGLVGFEREMRDKPAGFRTIILISLGACLFTIMSQVVGGPDLNSTRIAAHIVTGIGFLGAGALLRDRKAVFGLTTAATICAVAAIGMACGFGDLGMAATGTAGILIALFVFDALEIWIGARRDIQDYHVVTTNDNNPFDRMNALFKKARLRVRKRTCYEDESALVFHIIAMGAKTSHDQLRMDLAKSADYTLKRS